MASIIPSPKSAGWAIDSAGHVKDRFGHFRLLKNRLLAMDSANADTSVFNVQFSPRAIRRFKGKPKADVIVPQDVGIENIENEELIPE